MNDYRQFLRAKHKEIVATGFEVDLDGLNPRLKQWQRDLVVWLCKLGRGGGFEATGLGKTFQQLVIGELIVRQIGGKVLIVCPLPGINVINYERVHKLDPADFVCVILDESSILKSFTGTTKRALCSMFARTPYRYVFSATPAPNDYLELGNQCEFLGVMRSNEMQSSLSDVPCA